MPSIHRATPSHLAVVFLLGLSALAQTTDAFAAEGPNIAHAKPHTISPAPGYSYCTDDGDAVQLTDGETTSEYFWTQKGTVGWQHATFVTVVVDLGKIEPISGAAFRTAAGTAGVSWPACVGIHVSDDGTAWHDVGDLVSLDLKEQGPLPDGYGIRRFATGSLQTRGRFVRFFVIPTGPYVFCDEVEVFRGPDSLLEKGPGGAPVGDYEALAKQFKMRSSILRRYGFDLKGISQMLESSGLAAKDIAPLLDGLTQAYEGAMNGPLPDPQTFRTVLPFNASHAAMFQIQAFAWESLGFAPLSAWVADTWAPAEPYRLPPKPDESDKTMEVHLMRGEYRASALDLANATSKTKRITISFEGLPGGPTPAYVTPAEVPWTDTIMGRAVAAALPPLEPADGVWTVSVDSGIPRRVWFTWRVTDLEPGEYEGRAVVRDGEDTVARLPVRLTVYPFEFPAETTLLLGGWSYTNGGGSYGITAENRPAFLAHMREHYVNAPWATRGVLGPAEFDEDGNVKLNTAEWDDWRKQWPGAKCYCIFLSLGGLDGDTVQTFGGATAGTPEFDEKVGRFFSAWAAHWKSQGIDPSRIVLLGHDEPRGDADVEAIGVWVKAIRKAVPEIRHFSDPVYPDPTKPPAELFDLFDILCPNRPMWLTHRKTFDAFYGRQAEAGKTLQLYSCSGPARLLDPYSYYRLQAWHCHEIGATGTFFWAFGDNQRETSWNEYLVRSGPYTPLFIDAKSITPGIQMEAIRESIQDFETLVMLRDAAQKAAGNAALLETVRAAETLLSDGVDGVLSAEGVDKLGLFDEKDRTKADAVRVEALKLLHKLQ